MVDRAGVGVCLIVWAEVRGSAGKMAIWGSLAAGGGEWRVVGRGAE